MLLTRMDAAPDGSPVDVYTRLPELGEGELVASVLPPVRRCSSSAADRADHAATRPAGLSRDRGRRVARDARACPRRGRSRRRSRGSSSAAVSTPFSSQAISSTAEPEQRRAFLETCRRHADLVICEGLPLGWSPEDGERRWERSLPLCVDELRGRSRPRRDGVRGRRRGMAALLAMRRGSGER